MSEKPPYTFPLESRAAIATFLDRNGRFYGTRYRFCWNVKCHFAHFDSDTLRQIFPAFAKKYDKEWEAWIDCNLTALSLPPRAGRQP